MCTTVYWSLNASSMQVLQAGTISTATPSNNFSVHLSYECSVRKRKARRAASQTDGILASISPPQMQRISDACITRN